MMANFGQVKFTIFHGESNKFQNILISYLIIYLFILVSYSEK